MQIQALAGNVLERDLPLLLTSIEQVYKRLVEPNMAAFGMRALGMRVFGTELGVLLVGLPPGWPLVEVIGGLS
jgi:hypothetical protein